MHLEGEFLDPLAQFLGQFGQAGVLLEQFEDLGGDARCFRFALDAGLGDGFAVAGVGVGVGLVAVGLPGLGQQNQRRGIGPSAARRPD